MKQHWGPIGMTALLLLLLSIGFSGHLYALQPIKITELIPINFGIINKPNIGANTFSLHWNTNMVTASGSGNGWFIGDALSGKYQIKAQPNMVIHVNADIMDFSTGGVQVTKVFVNGPEPTATAILRKGSAAFAQLGGEVLVSSSSIQGSHATTVLLSLNYE